MCLGNIRKRLFLFFGRVSSVARSSARFRREKMQTQENVICRVLNRERRKQRI